MQTRVAVVMAWAAHEIAAVAIGFRRMAAVRGDAICQLTNIHDVSAIRSPR